MVTLVSIIFLLFSLLTITHSTSSPNPYPHYPQDLDKAITSAATYLRHVLNDDGSFKYETLGSTETSIYPLEYNSVRHAGTIWSLTLFIQYSWFIKNSPAKASRDVAISATKWLYPLIVSPKDENGTFSHLKGLLKTPDTELDESLQPNFALGGNGLALVALASMKELDLMDDINIEILRGMGRFIIYLMTEEGDFSGHYFYQGEGLRANKKKCEFYPGEAALGLIKLYAVDPQIHWLESARDILEFLAKKHLKKLPEIIDHWYMIATQHLFIYQDLLPLSKDILVPSLINLSKEVLNISIDDWCITSALVEGLAASCLLLKQEFGLGHHYHGLYDGVLEELTEHLIDGTKKLIACQGSGGGLAGSLNDVGTDSYRVRIDYNQHTMSAWIRTYEFLYTKDYEAKY